MRMWLEGRVPSEVWRKGMRILWDERKQEGEHTLLPILPSMLGSQRGHRGGDLGVGIL